MHNSEINIVVKNSLDSLSFYENIFCIERIEVGDFILGQNEVTIKINELYLRLLDENPDFNMLAPQNDTYIPFWFNITVNNIEQTYNQALNLGCTKIQDVNHMPEMGIKNAMFKDPYSYTWLLHEVIEIIDYETRVELLEKQGFKRNKD